MYFSLMSKLINLLGPLLLVPIFVKYLTVEEYGAWLMILSIATYFFLIDRVKMNFAMGSGEIDGTEAVI